MKKEIQLKLSDLKENKARNEATTEGIENRKKDLISTLKNDLDINEKNLFEYSDLKNIQDLNSLFVKQLSVELN